jgi:hypothetical protein
MPDPQEQVLAQFQKRLGRQQEATVDYDEDLYHAFKAVDRSQRRLLLKPVGTPWEWLPYQYLLRIVLDPKATRIALVFSFMAVTITGRNLTQMAGALAEERCEFIQEFDPKHWPKPTDPEAAYVESIEFITERPPAEAARIVPQE